MIQYKKDYYVIQQKDIAGKPTSNRDDTYIPCKRKAQIYRYNDNTLGIMFLTQMYASNRIKDLAELGIELILEQDGDDECTYLFKESDLSTVAEVVKAKNRVKRNYTEEQLEVLRQRMTSIRQNIQS